jgi:hypothetical protein
MVVDVSNLHIPDVMEDLLQDDHIPPYFAPNALQIVDSSWKPVEYAAPSVPRDVGFYLDNYYLYRGLLMLGFDNDCFTHNFTIDHALAIRDSLHCAQSNFLNRPQDTIFRSS